MSNGGSYEPRAIEPEIYKFWEQGGYFHAEPDPDRKPYVIDIPLPNVTGSLHLGHALNNTVQDVLIRRERMRGFNAMWMPGTDHAGIATQAVVEKRLKEDENLSRHEIGREGLVKRIWEWKEKYGGQILQQLRRIGCSCDWERTRFTLDEVCARAVYEVFFRWFKEGLIYRGLRLVNWDAQLQTAVADDEIIYETVPSNLWHYRYPIEGHDATKPIEGSVGVSPAEGGVEGKDYVVIATTRPETMLGDTAVAVHPDDERYKHLVGKNCILPLVDRPIPIIADPILVKPEFGTGCVKVTPGHDPNDYQFGERHRAEIKRVLGYHMINILTTDGRINENGGKYAGMGVEEARAKVVADLETLGLMEKIEPYQHDVGHSDRSKTPIEPMLSEQWFVKMADLCELAMDAVRDGRVKFFPERYAKTYLDWLGEKRDWCISRQLWWGHRIPVWTAMISIRHQKSMQGPRDYRKRRQRELAGELQVALEEFGRVVGCRSDFSVRPAEEGPSAHLYVCARTPRAQEELAVVAESLTCHRTPSQEDSNVIPIIWHGDRRQPAYERIRSVVGSLKQDEDVLDTWFSSAIWPFSTLGWPHDYGRHEGTEARRHEGADVPTDLDYFYPTSVLVTAREIITLWVARMVMTGLYFQDNVPFDHVHIHPNIQDGTGRRMSKSAGNGVDPIDIVELYGADAMRFTLVQMSTETQDVRMPVSYLCPHCQTLIAQDSVVPKNKVPAEVQKVTCKQCKKPFATVWASDQMKQELGVARDTSNRFELGRNFCNKLWQAATGFVIPNIQACGTGILPVDHRQDAGATEDLAAAPGGGRSDRLQTGPTSAGWPRSLKPDDLAIEDQWILSRLSACIEEVDRRFERYQLNEAANALYGFFWGEFCDWYVELVKPRLFSRNDAGEMVRHDDESSHVARQVLGWVLDQTLRLLHPIVPFITEKLWHKLSEAAPQRGIQEIRSVGPPSPTQDEKTIGPALISAQWPDASAWHRETGVEREMQALQDVIRGLREIRTHVNKIRSAAKQGSIRSLPRAVVKADARLAESLRQREAMLHRLGQCDTLEIGPDVAKPPESASKVLSGIEVYVPLAGLADLGIERDRLRKERDELAGHIQRLESKLANQGFVSKAPQTVVERERSRLAELRERVAAVVRNLAEVGG